MISSVAHLYGASVLSALSSRYFGNRKTSTYLSHFVSAAAWDVMLISSNCWGRPLVSSATVVSSPDILNMLSADSIVVFAVIFCVIASPVAAGMRFILIRKTWGAFVISIGADVIMAVL